MSEIKVPPEDGGEMDKREMLNANSEMADDAAIVLDPKSQDLIGRALKAHFDDLTTSPLPDRFMALLAELEAKDKSTK
jgi:hypothetical protein